MKRMRVTRIQVLGGGLALAVAIGVLFFLIAIRPIQANIKKTVADAEAEEAVARTRASAEAALAAAEARRDEVFAKYDHIMQTRMPKFSVKDPIVAMFDAWHLPQEEANLMNNWFARSGAVVSQVSVPAWFGTNWPSTDMRMLPPVDWTLNVTVKDVPALLNWLKKIPEAPRFMVLRSVSIPGPRPANEPLTATVAVTLYMWTRDAQVQAAAAPAATAAGAGAAAGPAAGRGPGGAGGRGGPGMRGRGGMGMGRGGRGPGAGGPAAGAGGPAAGAGAAGRGTAGQGAAARGLRGGLGARSGGEDVTSEE